MTTYFVDADNGNDGNAGTSTGAAFRTLSQAIETTTLSAGDIVILRRGMTNQYATSDAIVSQDESGTLLNPIVVEADYDNNFSDDVDLSATATATLTFGSKTITFSSDISSVLAAGDWIYEVNDDQRDFAYEVKSVVTTTVTLYLPYKGGNAGSGKTMTNMQSAPVWGTTSYTVGYLSMSDYTRTQGLEVRSNDGSFVFLSGRYAENKDITAIGGASSTNQGLRNTLDEPTIFRKCRTSSVAIGVQTRNNTFHDCFLNVNATGGECIVADDVPSRFIDCENDTGEYVFNGTNAFFTLRNCNLSGSTSDYVTTAANSAVVIGIEDDKQVAGVTKKFDSTLTEATVTDTFVYESDTTTVRSGGSNISIEVTPTDDFNTNTELGFLTPLELPIYSDTTSKTYTVYFRTGATTDWTANPTASELFIELEAYGHSSNASRLITKSTGTLNFTGSTAWQALTVTVAPGKIDNAARLRVKYGKTKEATKTNVFFIDPLVVIS